MAMTGVNRAGVGVTVLGVVALGLGLANLYFKKVSDAAMIALAGSGAAATLLGLGMATARKTTRQSEFWRDTTITTTHVFGIGMFVTESKEQVVEQVSPEVRRLLGYARVIVKRNKTTEVAAQLMVGLYTIGGREKLIQDLNTFEEQRAVGDSSAEAAFLLQVKGYLEAESMEFDH